jgi:uncharacterized membrane protein YjfL (UPF0719 family)
VVLALLLVVLVVIGSFVFMALSRAEGFDLVVETTQSDNPAVGLRYALFLLAMVISFSQVIYPAGSFADNLEVVAKYGLPVILVTVAAFYINKYAILHGFDSNRHVVAGKNISVAIVEGAACLATALIVSSTLVGLETDFAESMTWLIIGQALLVGIAFLYRALVPQVFEALEQRNLACALSLGGLLLSLGLALSAAVSGPSSGWSDDLQAVGLFMLGWLAFMVFAHFLADLIALPSVRLRTEVMDQANVAAGVLEAVFFIGLTLLYTYVVG